MTPELLTTFLSSLHQTFRDRISSALLIPLTTAAIALVFLHGSTQGWEWYTALWKDAGAVERALLVGVVAFGVLFCAAALDALTSPVNRVFERGPWGYAILATKEYRHRWDELDTQKLGWEALYTEFKTWFPGRDDVPVAPEAGTDLAPDSSWRSGMRLLALVVADDHLPHKLKAGQVVNLSTDAKTVLVPGGALVTDVSATTDEDTIDSRAITLREITIVVPPDAIRELAAMPVESVFVSRRVPPAPTPFWDVDAGWTRRWIVPATGEGNLASCEPEAGDLLVLTPPTGNLMIVATFCERIGSRWVVALRENDLGDTFNLAALRDLQSPSTWTRGTAPVPLLTAAVPAWAALPQTDVCEIPVQQGTVTILDTDYRADDLVLDADALANRYATGEMALGSPILTSRVSPADSDLAIVAWRKIWETDTASMPEAGRFCHFRETTGSTTKVRFNCRMLENDQVAIPTSADLTDDARLLYSNGGALPNAPSDAGGLAPWSWHAATEQRISISPMLRLGAYNVLVIPAGATTACEATQAVGDAVPGRVEFNAISPPAGTGHLREAASTAIPAIIYGIDGKTVIVLAERPIANPDGPRSIDGSYLKNRECLIEEVLNETDPKQACTSATQLRNLVEVAHAHLTLDAEFQPARSLRTRLAATNAASEGRRVREAIQYWVDQSRERLTLTMPLNRNLIVGTEFGNIVQTIASHGHEAYGMHTPVTLSRIIAKVSADDRKPLDAAKDQISLLQWSFITSLVVAIAGSWMLFRDGVPWWQPIVLYTVAGIAIPAACLSGLRSAGLNYAAEAKFLMDSQRGLVLDALGIDRPKGEAAAELILEERNLWNAVGQWLEYGTEDHPLGVPAYTLPPAAGGSAGAKESNA